MDENMDGGGSADEKKMLFEDSINRMCKKFFMFYILLVFLVSLSNSEEKIPERIVSLGTHLTEEIYLLKVDDRLIADTIYCQNPPSAKNKEKIGTVTKVDVEKILKLKPDLILATSLSDKQQIEKLKNLGLNVVVFYQPKSFDEICEHFLRLAKIVGKEKIAKEIVNHSKLKVDSIKRATKKFQKPKIFVQLGAKPLFTVSEDSFIRDFIEFAGGINIAQDAGVGYYSYEKVISSNPDIILITSMGVAGEKEKKIWQKYKTLNAVKNNRIYVIDSYKMCSPTPVTFVSTLEELAGLFHPELKGKIRSE